MTNKPIEKLNYGATETAIWRNEREKDGKRFYAYNVTSPYRKYKDKNGEYQNTYSLRPNDLLMGALNLIEAAKRVDEIKRKEAFDEAIINKRCNCNGDRFDNVGGED